MTVPHVEAIERRFDEFLALGRPCVDGAIAMAVDNFASGQLPEGRWHPNGFVVFNLADVEGLGLLRLHYWPAFERPQRRRHPTIHRHSFHLHSSVLAGVYRERMFQASELDARSSIATTDGAVMRGFLVQASRGDGVDRLTRETLYVVKPSSEVRTFFAGTDHQFPAGEFHATLVPFGMPCVTLALLSRPVPGETDLLVGRDDFTELEAARPIWSPHTPLAHTALRELLLELR